LLARPIPGKPGTTGAENLKFLLKFRLQPLRDGVVCLPPKKGACQKRARDFRLAQFCPGRNGGGPKDGPGSRAIKLSLFWAPQGASEKAVLFEKLVLGVWTLRMVDR
jgi:hypothetical protein